MKGRKSVTGSQRNRASGGAGIFTQKALKKDQIRNLYDRGSKLDIKLEKVIVKLYKAVTDRLYPDGK